MSPLLLAIFIVALLAGAWFAWRYLKLHSRLRLLSRALESDPPRSLPKDTHELQELVRAIGSLIASSRFQLSTLGLERDRLAAVLDQMTDGVLIADGQGRIEFANPAARRLFENPDPLGHSVAEVIRNHQLIAAWRRCQQSNEIQSESVEVPGRHQFLQLIVMPDTHAGGSLLLAQDLTRVRRLETVRRDFVSNISHELRTPLASLRALTETLQEGALSDPQAAPQFLEQMVKEVDALTQMTQELLDLSRIESGQVALAFTKTAPRKLLDSAAARMNMQAERAGIRLQVDCRPDLPDLHGDPARLEQVLVNLIHNAVKFTPPGGDVILSADLDEPQASEATGPGGTRSIRLAVKDTGIGIPADDVPRIFERFYQVDKARTGSGTGLGLSISRHIVEAHGGRIWAESTEGQGSTFFFTIPQSQ
jgi:two-component system phosphate regulon sensor histidine kinase PhoR